MAKIQLSSGAASSSTHHLTQSSQAIDRRSVVRPTNLAIEEAARSVQAPISETSTTQPSRLVNLRVHASDLVSAQAAPETPVASFQSYSFVPNVIELGNIDRDQPADLPPVDLNEMVPAEAPFEEPSASYAPAIVPPAPTEMIMTQATAIVSTSNNTSSISAQDLAMNIAADYAAANLGAVEADNSSIDAIAQATSEAIAAIRSATDPEEIAKQVASLQTFAENIKASSSAPEMLELSNTIDKFIEVAMKSTKIQEEVHKKSLPKAKSAQSITIKSAAPAKTSTKLSSKPTTRTTTKPRTITKSTQTATRRPARAASRTHSSMVADEDLALRKALRNVAAMDGDPEEKSSRRPIAKKRGGGKRLVLAFFCAILCVAGIVYFVGSSLPDISVKVAAIQTGIEASYPSYIPRDYSLNDINSEDGKITMTFKGPEKASFTLTEEKSSWDSTALLRNYVEPTWQTNYITTHEQGITIYISGANAAWVNGGVLYKINASNNTLTKKQLRNIVTSM